jgi:dihydrolipoamide dehydrogenase
MEKLERDLVVLGGGPGGYSAAFRAADLGRSVTIIEKNDVLGGVCLNVGCIPSKTLLHYGEVLADVEELRSGGIEFGAPKIDFDKIREHKNKVISQLTGGLAQMCKARKVEIIQGEGFFKDDKTLIVKQETKEVELSFKDLIIGVGSRPVKIGGIDYQDSRIWDSTDALELKEIPKRMLIIGGGIIGMEMAAIYHSFGTEITIVEMADAIIPAIDRDLRHPLLKQIKNSYKGIYTSTKVTKVDSSDKKALTVHLEGKKAPESVEVDVVLVAVGRITNTDKINIENSSIKVDQRNWITVDQQMKTNVPNIYAIGDVTGNPMLAHRSTAQGKVASEVANGLPSQFTPLTIPSVAYTRPEIAWIGITENEAKEKDIEYKKGSFPWQASGRALSAMADQGVTKALFDAKTGRLIGAGITGKNAGELIGEALLALEMGSDAFDIALTVHPHPTLIESFAVASELSEGIATDLTNR